MRDTDTLPKCLYLRAEPPSDGAKAGTLCLSLVLRAVDQTNLTPEFFPLSFVCIEGGRQGQGGYANLTSHLARRARAKKKFQAQKKYFVDGGIVWESFKSWVLTI